MERSSHGGLENYASPHLRAAVFRRLNPDAQISYEVVPIEDAFPPGHRKYRGEATEAVRCKITWPDGHYVISHKEIDLKDERRGSAIEQTPENLVKDETKALGRALRDAGIPQRLSELRELMRWVQPTAIAATSSRSTTPVEAQVSVIDPEDDDPDAGADDPTPEQVLADMVSKLNGSDKAAISRVAKDKFNLSNVMRAGQHAEALIEMIEKRTFATVVDDVEDPF